MIRTTRSTATVTKALAPLRLNADSIAQLPLRLDVSNAPDKVAKGDVLIVYRNQQRISRPLVDWVEKNHPQIIEGYVAPKKSKRKSKKATEAAAA